MQTLRTLRVAARTAHCLFELPLIHSCKSLPARQVASVAESAEPKAVQARHSIVARAASSDSTEMAGQVTAEEYETRPVNNLLLYAKVTSEPQVRSVNTYRGQVEVCNVTVTALDNETEKLKFRLAFWDKKADIGRHLKLDQVVCVTGSLTQDRFKTKEGKERMMLAVSVQDCSLMDINVADSEPLASPEA